MKARFRFSVTWLLMHANTVVFSVGLAVLCASVARWSAPAAGVIAGAVLMLIGVWPILAARRGEP